MTKDMERMVPHLKAAQAIFEHGKFEQRDLEFLIKWADAVIKTTQNVLKRHGALQPTTNG